MSREPATSSWSIPSREHHMKKDKKDGFYRVSLKKNLYQ
jgi:hypothetical protein